MRSLSIFSYWFALLNHLHHLCCAPSDEHHQDERFRTAAASGREPETASGTREQQERHQGIRGLPDTDRLRAEDTGASRSLLVRWPQRVYREWRMQLPRKVNAINPCRQRSVRYYIHIYIYFFHWRKYTNRKSRAAPCIRTHEVLLYIYI